MELRPLDVPLYRVWSIQAMSDEGNQTQPHWGRMQIDGN